MKDSTARVLNLISIVILSILVLILVGAAVAAYIGMSSIFGPMQRTSSGLSTQVSQLLHPTPTIVPDPVTIIHEVRSLARLETVQYSVEQVIRAETNQGPFGWLFGQKLLFVAHGIVIAGIDMEKIEVGDMWVEGGVLHVVLPPAEVFIATLDNQKSYVFDYEKGLLSPVDPQLETEVRQEAEEKIRAAAIEDGILDLAMQNAQSILERFFRVLGYPEVIFETTGLTPTPTP